MPGASQAPVLLPRRIASSANLQPPRAETRRSTEAGEPFAGYFATASAGVGARMRQSSLTASASGVLPSAVGAGVLAAGARYVGAAYELGAGRNVGFTGKTDCSAFVTRAYSDATGGRVRLTPYTDAMYAQTQPVGSDGPRPGDLVFYRGEDSTQPGTRYPHVALYVGPGRVLDASSVAGKVAYRTQSLGAGYPVEYRRVAV